MANKFSSAAKRTLCRLGDLIIPGDRDLHSFSAAGGIAYVDQYIAGAPKDDIMALNAALSVLSLAPNIVLVKFMDALASSDANDTPLGTPLRQLNLAIRGLIFSCYYNDNVGVPGARPIDAIGFNIKRVYD